MKYTKYIMFISSFVLVSGGIAYADYSRGQYQTVSSPVHISIESKKLVPNLISAETIPINVNTDATQNVPQGVFIAHITTDRMTIDVQRFIDTSVTPNVACYYSESAGTVISVNCSTLK